MTDNRCSVCASPCSLKCACCMSVFYCSREHQKQHWKDHKLTCTGRKTTKDPNQRPEWNTKDTWARGLSAAQQREWIIDCYRMRSDDDVKLAGYRHGLYVSRKSIAPDFAVYVRVALDRGFIPENVNWLAFLQKGAFLMIFPFGKSDAREKYGEENTFNALKGGRSLRATAEEIYNSPVKGKKDALVEKYEKLSRAIDFTSLEDMERHEDFFSCMGGAVHWFEMAKNVSRPFPR